MTNSQLFRLFFIFIFLGTLAISSYYRRRARQSGEVISRTSEGGIFLAGRAILAAALFLPFLAYMLNPAWMNWSALALPDWLRWLGVAAGLAILPMIYWVMTSIGKNISETTLTKSSHELITHGPYNWIRHPLYTFATIGFVSLAVVAGNWLMLAMALLAFGAIAWFVVPREEAELINKFGSDYQNYQERTGRFTPWSRRAR